MRVLKQDRGQMTVELCVLLPVILVIASIVFNLGTYLAECSSFDRVARNVARSVCAVPSNGSSNGDQWRSVVSKVDAFLQESGSQSEFSFARTVDADGYDVLYFGLEYHPTLFGLSLRGSVFGVSLPTIDHKVCLTLDDYEPGGSL